MTILLGALAIGLILSLLAFGVYISFRMFGVADITVDGTFTLGAAVAAVLMVGSESSDITKLLIWITQDKVLVMKLLAMFKDPVVATFIAMLAGAMAGLVTGFLQTKCRINPLLSGILVMTALYSVNLRVMGKSNIALPGDVGLGAWAEQISQRLFNDAQAGGAPARSNFTLLGWEVGGQAVVMCAGAAIIAVVVALALYGFFRTNLGTAIRASGDNPQMVSALGVSVDFCRIFGLALSNALVSLAGALFCQYNTFADAQMGIGIIVSGLASVIIGEAMTGSRSLGWTLVGAVMGSVLFRLLFAIAMRLGLPATDLKFVTAVCLFVALAFPPLWARLRRPKPVLID